MNTFIHDKLTQSIVFIDGATIGTTIDDSMSVKATLSTEEGKIIQRTMKRAGAISEKGELRYVVNGVSSAMMLSLRPGANKAYFNLTGNPITFLSEDNISGYGDASAQISKCFATALGILEANAGHRLPEALKQMIRRGQIYIHSLEFAAYTKELNKKRYLSSVQHVLGQGSRSGDQRTSVCTMLGIRVTQNYDNQTIGLAFPYRKMGDEKKLLIYDKAAQMQGLTRTSRNFLKNRLRFDLHLDRLWFERRKIRTVADFHQYVNSVAGEATMVEDEIRDCIKRACLEYMFTIRRQDLLTWAKTGERPPHLRPDLDYKTHLTLWAALQMDVDDSVKHGLLRGDAKQVLTMIQESNDWAPTIEVEKQNDLLNS